MSDFERDAAIVVEACSPEQVVLMTTRSSTAAAALGVTGDDGHAWRYEGISAVEIGVARAQLRRAVAAVGEDAEASGGAARIARATRVLLPIQRSEHPFRRHAPHVAAPVLCGGAPQRLLLFERQRHAVGHATVAARNLPA